MDEGKKGCSQRAVSRARPAEKGKEGGLWFDTRGKIEIQPLPPTLAHDAGERGGGDEWTGQEEMKHAAGSLQSARCGGNERRGRFGWEMVGGVC